MKTVRHSIRLLGGIALLCWLTAPSGRAQTEKQEAPIRPSFAQASQVEVAQGEQVEIELKARPTLPGTTYLLRSKPERGRLGPIQVQSNGSASVTYFHDPAFSGTEDRFFYAVQHPGAAVSAKTEVAIRIIDPSPRLEGPSSVLFGAVALQQTSRQTVTIRNTGARPYAGKALVTKPWHLAQVDSTIKVKPGESLNLILDFTPSLEGPVEGKLSFSGNGGTSLLLQGEGVQSLVVQPNPVQLRILDPVTGKRTGRVQLQNQTAHPLDLTFQTSDNLQPVKSLQLAGQIYLELEASPLVPTASEGKLTIKTGGYETSLPVHIPALPARLQFAPDTRLEFGQIPEGQRARKTIEVRNQGGETADLSATIEDGLTVTPHAFNLKPGERREVHVEIITAHSGSRTHSIVFDWGNKSHTIIATAEVLAASIPSQASNQTAPVSPPSGRQIDMAAVANEALQIVDIRVEEGRVHIFWNDPFPEPRRYKLERFSVTSKTAVLRQAVRDYTKNQTNFTALTADSKYQSLLRAYEAAEKHDAVLKQWTVMDEARFDEPEPGLQHVSFPTPSGLSLTVRLSSISSSGALSPAQSTIRIPLPQKTSWQWPHYTPYLILSGLAIGGIAFWRWRRLR